MAISEEKRIENRRRNREYRQRLYATPEGRASVLERQADYRATHREEIKERVEKSGNLTRRRIYIQTFKLWKGCADCGYRDNPDALHFDHLPGFEKSFGISNQYHTRKWSIVLAEIEKCEVVCANCHSIRTAERRPKSHADAYKQIDLVC